MDQERMEARRHKKREAMLDAAMGLLIEHGSDGLTIAALAKSLSLSVGALYRYFDGKEHIMVELQKRAIRRFQERLVEDVAEVDAWATAAGMAAEQVTLLRLLAACFAYARDEYRAQEEHHLMRAIMNPPTHILSVAMAMEVDKTIQPLLVICADLLRAAQEGGVLRPGDAMMRTYVVWALMQGTDGFVKRDRFQQEPFTSPFIIRSAFSSIMLGWGCAPTLLEHVIPAYDQWLDS